MPAVFCTEPGCDRVAVGVGYWQGRGGNINPAQPRPRRCRAHYLELCGGEFVRFEVTGDARLVDARTGESMGRGHVIELDPVATNVRALAAAGFCRPETPKAARGEGRK